MGNVESLFFRVIFTIISLALISVAIYFFVKYKKAKDKKALAISIVLIAFAIVFNLFLYVIGQTRKCPLSEQEIGEVYSTIIGNIENNGSDYYDCRVDYYCERNKGTNTANLCYIEKSINTAQSIENSKSLLIKRGKVEGKYKYCCSPVSSDRSFPFLHSMYSGVIEYTTDDGVVYDVNYYISRKIDRLFGFVYAAPFTSPVNISSLLVDENADFTEKAIQVANNYISENLPQYSKFGFFIQTVAEYNDAITAGEGVGYSSTPFNKDVFIPIDYENGNDYLFIFYETDDYSKKQNGAIIVLDRENFEINKVVNLGNSGDGSSS